MTPAEAAVLALAAGSAFFSLVAAIGVVRLPDVYARAHATSKSDTLGTGLALAAAAVALESGAARLKLALLVAFVLLTNPVGAHTIARAAHLQGIPAWTSASASSPASTVPSASDADSISESDSDANADREGKP